MLVSWTMRSKFLSITGGFLLTMALVAAGCAGEEPPPGIVIPGDAVFPEGIAVDNATGDLYVGSTSDGTIFRAAAGAAKFEEFLPAGADGRTAATGLKVDPAGRLFVAGRTTGLLFVYDLDTRELVSSLEAPGEGDTLVNDLTFTTDAAYVTDSYRDVIYRIPLDDGAPEKMQAWLNLEDTVVPTGDGFGLNGISASDDGRYLITVHTDTGELFRIDTRSREVRPVELGEETLPTGDGLLLDGTTLFVVQEEPGQVVPIELSNDLLHGELRHGAGGDSLDFPTTLAETDGTIYVVNSQLNDAPDNPTPPFTVTELPVP